MREAERDARARAEHAVPGGLDAAMRVPDERTRLIFQVGGAEGERAYRRLTEMVADGAEEAGEAWRAFVNRKIARGVLTRQQADDLTYIAGRGALAASVVGPVGRVRLTAAELRIVGEARSILHSRALRELERAHAAGQDVTVRIFGRSIQYEPNLPMSGMTNFEDGGFHLGPDAFRSETELRKTILHELHRLHTSSSAEGVSSALAEAETQAAQEFADRAIDRLERD